MTRPSLRIAIAQFNAVLGDVAGNVDRLIVMARDAMAQGAQLLVTPELALCGYPPEDLLLRPDFYRICAGELERLASACPDIAILVGHPVMEGEQRFNVASMMQGGRCVATYRKQRLPNYREFDEARYFHPGKQTCVVDVAGVRCGIAICEDVWLPGVAEHAKAEGADLLLTLNASPFYRGKQSERLTVLRQRVAATGMSLLYVNLVGGQDELVFDGGSLALSADGNLQAEMPRFEEALRLLDWSDGRWSGGEVTPHLEDEGEVYRALVLGVRDYIGKNRFPGAIIGLSGGIDSALTLCIAVDARRSVRCRC